MTHLVLDQSVLDALIAAGDLVNHAAENRLCSCEFNVPYDSGQVARFLVAKCFRCRATEGWAKARNDITKAINESNGEADACAIRAVSMPAVGETVTVAIGSETRAGVVTSVEHSPRVVQ